MTSNEPIIPLIMWWSTWQCMCHSPSPGARCIGGEARAHERSLVDREVEGVRRSESPRILELADRLYLRATLDRPRIGALRPRYNPAMAVEVEGMKVVGVHPSNPEAHFR